MLFQDIDKKVDLILGFHPHLWGFAPHFDRNPK